jgi:hypothetical protein
LNDQVGEENWGMAGYTMFSAHAALSIECGSTSPRNMAIDKSKRSPANWQIEINK